MLLWGHHSAQLSFGQPWVRSVCCEGNCFSKMRRNPPCTLLLPLSCPWGQDVVALHTHPIGVHYELQDVAGVSRQGAHGGSWDQLTVVLEKYHHKHSLLVTGEGTTAGSSHSQT